MRLYLLVVLAACGRLGFDAGTQDAGGGEVGVPDATGSAGPRWAVTLGNNTRFVPIAGADGAPVAAWAFTTSTTVAGQTVTGAASATSSVVARFDAAGAVTATTVLDATTTCDMRGIAMRGDTAVVAGLTFGSLEAALGPCSVSTGRQDPILIAVDPAGTASALAHGIAGGANAQAWNVVPLPDATFVAAGIYSMNLTFGATSLPAAAADPNAWIARLSEAQADPVWSVGLTGGVRITPGPIATEGSELCMLGAYSGGGLTELGTALPYAGSVDALIARLDDAGTPRFVRGFGSPAMESDFNDGSVAAVGGGCVGSVAAAGDVTIGGTTLLASDGAAIVVWFDSAGTPTGAYRLPATAQLAAVGGRVIAAYTVRAPVTIGGATVTPQGDDVVVAELDAQGPSRLLGVAGGAGDQAVIRIAAIAPDAVAISLASSGEFQFGATAFTSAANDRVLAVLGI